MSWHTTPSASSGFSGSSRRCGQSSWTARDRVPTLLPGITQSGQPRVQVQRNCTSNGALPVVRSARLYTVSAGEGRPRRSPIDPELPSNQAQVQGPLLMWTGRLNATTAPVHLVHQSLEVAGARTQKCRLIRRLASISPFLTQFILTLGRSARGDAHSSMKRVVLFSCIQE